MSNIINSEKEIKHKEPYYIRCVKCGNYIKVRMFPEDIERIQNGDDTPIQEICPYLTPAERELFISGFCDECWNRVFSENL